MDTLVLPSVDQLYVRASVFCFVYMSGRIIGEENIVNSRSPFYEPVLMIYGGSILGGHFCAFY